MPKSEENYDMAFDVESDYNIPQNLNNKLPHNSSEEKKNHENSSNEEGDEGNVYREDEKNQS